MLRKLTERRTGMEVIGRVASAISSVCLVFFVMMSGSDPVVAQSSGKTLRPGEFQVAHFAGQRHNNWHRWVARKKKKPLQTVKPGWYPGESSKDPVQIIVSLPEQRMTVYQGDKPLVTSRVSSGQPGYSTPAGVFSILRKKRHHRSNIYSGAPMPFMQRLTWSGIALHQSNSVPNRPASHGCIRLPGGFAGQLFRFTQPGIHVVVANEKVVPVEIAHDSLFQPVPPALTEVAAAEVGEEIKSDATATQKEKRSSLPVRVLVTRYTGREQLLELQTLLQELSFDPGEIDGYMGPDTAKAIIRFQTTYGLKPDGLVSKDVITMLYAALGKGDPADGRLYVRQDFNPVFDAPVVIRDGDKSLGSHLYTAMHFEADATGTRWLAVTLTKGSGVNRHASKKINAEADGAEVAEAPEVSSAEDALSRIVIPADVRQRINEMLTPGSSLAITNDGVSRETMPKGTDFIVLQQ